MPKCRAMVGAEEMLSRLLLLAGCVAVLVASIAGDEQNGRQT